MSDRRQPVKRLEGVKGKMRKIKPNKQSKSEYVEAASSRSTNTASKYGLIKQILLDIISQNGLRGIRPENISQLFATIGNTFELVFVPGHYDHIENMAESLGFSVKKITHHKLNTELPLLEKPYILFINCGQHSFNDVIDTLRGQAQIGKLLQIVTTDWALKQLMNDFLGVNFRYLQTENSFVEVESPIDSFYVQHSGIWWLESSSYTIPSQLVELITSTYQGKVILRSKNSSIPGSGDPVVNEGDPLGIEFKWEGVPFIHFVSHLEMQQSIDSDSLTAEIISDMWGISVDLITHLQEQGVRLSELQTLLLSSTTLITLIYNAAPGCGIYDSTYSNVSAITKLPDFSISELPPPQALEMVIYHSFSLLSGMSLDYNQSQLITAADSLTQSTKSPLIGIAIAKVLKDSNIRSGPIAILKTLFKLQKAGELFEDGVEQFLKIVLNPLEGTYKMTLKEAISIAREIRDDGKSNYPSSFRRLFYLYLLHGFRGDRGAFWTAKYIYKNWPTKYVRPREKNSDLILFRELVLQAAAPGRSSKDDLRKMKVYKALVKALESSSKSTFAKLLKINENESLESFRDMMSRVTDFDERMVEILEMFRTRRISIIDIIKNITVFALNPDKNAFLPFIQKIFRSQAIYKLEPNEFVKAILVLAGDAKEKGFDYIKATTAAKLRYKNEDMTCKVCMMHEADTLFMPCGHCVTCSSCADELQARNSRCPMCRADIEGRKEGYFDKEFLPSKDHDAVSGKEEEEVKRAYNPEIVHLIISLMLEAANRVSKYIVHGNSEYQEDSKLRRIIIMDRSPNIAHLQRDSTTLLMSLIAAFDGNVEIYYINGNQLEIKKNIWINEFLPYEMKIIKENFNADQFKSLLNLTSNDELYFIGLSSSKDFQTLNQISIEENSPMITFFDGNVTNPIKLASKIQKSSKFKIIPGFGTLSLKQLNENTTILEQLLNVYRSIQKNSRLKSIADRELTQLGLIGDYQEIDRLDISIGFSEGVIKRGNQNFDISLTNPNGNCLIEALRKGLIDIGIENLPEDENQFRQIIIDGIRENLTPASKQFLLEQILNDGNQYYQNLGLEGDALINKYLENMRKPIENAPKALKKSNDIPNSALYAGYPEIIEVSRRFNVRINIITSNVEQIQTVNVEGLPEDAPQLYVYYIGRNHYNLATPIATDDILLLENNYTVESESESKSNSAEIENKYFKASDPYYIKYLKYKEKYLKLKQSINL